MKKLILKYLKYFKYISWLEIFLIVVEPNLFKFVQKYFAHIERLVSEKYLYNNNIFYINSWSNRQLNLLYNLKLEVLLVPLIVRSDVLFWSALVATGTRHSRSPLFILSWFPKTCISISYKANGTRDFRHRSPAHLCHNVSRTRSIGFMVHSSFENRDWMTRAEVAYAFMHLYTNVSRHAKTPFLSFIVSHDLAKVVGNMGGGEWRIEECYEQCANVCDSNEKTQILNELQPFWVMTNHVIPGTTQKNILD